MEIFVIQVLNSLFYAAVGNQVRPQEDHLFDRPEV
jgi:hypothetical protein